MGIIQGHVFAHGYETAAAIGVKGVASGSRPFILGHIPGDEHAVFHAGALKTRVVDGAAVPQFFQEILNFVVHDPVALRGRGRVEDTPLVRRCVGQSGKAAWVQKAPAPPDGDSSPGHVPDLVVLHNAAGGEADIYSGSVVKLLARVFDQIVRYVVVPRELRGLFGMVVLCRDAAHLDGRRGNIAEGVVDDFVVLAAGAEVQGNGAQMFKVVVLKGDVPGIDKAQIAGDAHGVGIVADFVGDMAVARQVEAALVEGIAVRAVGAIPGGMHEIQAFKPDEADRLVNIAVGLDQFFKNRQHHVGARHVLSRAGNVINGLGARIQIPFARFIQELIGVLPPVEQMKTP